MTSNKPYLIRALYEWLVDNDATPHIMVNTQYPGVVIPPGIDRDGQVVLNISMSAVLGLEILNSHVCFSARFSGVSHDIHIPIQAVMAIYSLEDGEGMMFAEESSEQTASDHGEDSTRADTGKSDGATAAKSKPGLKVVK